VYESRAISARSPGVAARSFPFRDGRDDVEVRPPERGGDGDSQQRAGDDARVDAESGRADSQRHDRFAERDDHDQAVALSEVRRFDLPVFGSPQYQAAVVDRQRSSPADGSPRLGQEPGEHQHRRGRQDRLR
jgi:hypothetical protein